MMVRIGATLISSGTGHSSAHASHATPHAANVKTLDRRPSASVLMDGRSSDHPPSDVAIDRGRGTGGTVKRVIPQVLKLFLGEVS